MSDFETSWLIRLILYSAFAAVMVALAGCQSGGSIDLSLKGKAEPRLSSAGSTPETRNQTPQGGIDEKSGDTPTESMGRLP